MKKSYILGLVILIGVLVWFVYGRVYTRVSPIRYVVSSEAAFSTSSDIILSKITPITKVSAEGLKTCRNESRGNSSSTINGNQRNQTATSRFNKPANQLVATATPVNSSKFLLATSTSATTTTYHLYVSTTGSDSNPGTQEAPFKTITHAAGVAKPSTTVHVATGIYRGNVLTNVSGTTTGRIRYQSDSKWGAKIIGSGTEAMWTNTGNYTDIADFDITGPGSLGILNDASYTTITGNHVHNLTISGGCTSNGGAGILNANYRGSDNDIIGNVVHDIGIPGSCSGVQGIYHSNLRGHIYNNIVYRVSSYGIHLWHAANNVTIAHNTVFQNGSSGMGGGIIIGTGDSPGGVVLDNTKVINNIVYNNPASSITEYCYSGQSCIGSHNTISNNLVYGNGSAISMKVGSSTGTISADPQFIDYQANGTGDYRLKRTSPAIDKGISSDKPSTDINNAARVLGASVDIGAYENY